MRHAEDNRMLTALTESSQAEDEKFLAAAMVEDTKDATVATGATAEDAAVEVATYHCDGTEVDDFPAMCKKWKTKCHIQDISNSCVYTCRSCNF